MLKKNKWGEICIPSFTGGTFIVNDQASDRGYNGIHKFRLNRIAAIKIF